VEKVDPALVYRNGNGEVESVRYDMVNAMLLNEFLKEHKAFVEERKRADSQDRKTREQQATIAALKSNIAQQFRAIQAVRAQLKEQARQIQTVNAQLKRSRAAPQQATLMIP
jgi:septal ring factor EnvC (AmiA/AmiB activator)